MTHAEAPSAGFGAIAALLRVEHARLYLGGRIFAALGNWMERIALGWLVWELTQSPGWVGAVVFLRLAPALVLGPLGGVLADRVGAIRVIMRCHFGMAAVTGALVVAVAVDAAGLVAVSAATLALGALQALSNAPSKSAISHVAPRALLPTAIAANSTGFNAATLVGPAAAGLIIAAAGPLPVFVASCAATLTFALVLRRIPEAEVEEAGGGSALRAFGEAAVYAGRHPLIGPVLLLHVAMSMLLRPLIDMLPAYVGAALDGGAQALGFLTSALGLGAIAGGSWMVWRGGAPGLGARTAVAAALSAIGAVALSLASTPIMAAGLLALVGAAMLVRTAGAQTIVQLAVADGLRGRVMGVWGVILRVGSALGGLILGLGAELVGFRMALAVSAGLCLVAALASWPALRRSDRAS